MQKVLGFDRKLLLGENIEKVKYEYPYKNLMISRNSIESLGTLKYLEKGCIKKIEEVFQRWYGGETITDRDKFEYYYFKQDLIGIRSRLLRYKQFSAEDEVDCCLKKV